MKVNCGAISLTVPDPGKWKGLDLPPPLSMKKVMKSVEKTRKEEKIWPNNAWVYTLQPLTEGNFTWYWQGFKFLF
jgi:hypothetical protein